MKLTAFLLIISLHLSAGVLSQKISIKGKDMTLPEVFDLIKKQTGYSFVYSNALIDKTHRVTLNVQSLNINEVMDICLKDQPVSYTIINKAIVIAAKDLFTINKQPEELPEPVVAMVKGRVTDNANKPIPGVTVTVKSNQRSTVTDDDGVFTVEIPKDNDVLVFTNVGYTSREVPVKANATINIQLEEFVKDLNQVVVIGYGTVRKSDLTGAVSKIKSEEINSFPAANALQAISGRTPGVQVLQNNGSPGAPISVRVRGTNSLQGSNEPLYVIDGFPIAGSNPTLFNNSDIESIEVLKDASATAIYGSRGANGVVIITTKKGKSGKTRIGFDASYGVQALRKKLDLMNAKEYAMFYNEQAKNDSEAPYFTQSAIDALGEGTDWQDLAFRRAPMKSIGVSASGGNEQTQYFISASYFGQEGIIRTTDYNRYSIRANIRHELNKKLSFELGTTLTRINSDRQAGSGGVRGKSLISAVLSAPPTLQPYNADGKYTVFIAQAPPSAALNPLNFLNEQTDRVKANRLLANAAIIYKPISDLTIKISGGVENADDRYDAFTTGNFINAIASASVTSVQATSFLSENTIEYKKTFKKKHNVAILAGFTYQDFLNTSLTGSGTGFVSNTSQTYDLGAATIPGIPLSSYEKATILSYLSRLNYSYDGRYLATFSFRADGSSKYSEGSKWGYFPSGAIAWRVSKEKFFKDIDFISDLKLRAGWGLTGSQAINPYATLNQLVSGKTVFDNTLFTTYAPGTTLPGNLKWETTEQKDIGLDVSFFNNRITFTADYYVKNTRDLLNTVQLPASLGFTNTIQNVGEVQNKGVELGVDARIINNGSLTWDVNTNISFNRNKVVKLYGGQDVLGGLVAVTIVNDNANILREGQPIGQFWGYMEDGYTPAGKIKYADLDKDGQITIKDKTYIGDPNPDFIYGFNSTLVYKNFEFVAFVQGVSGNDIFNISAINNTIDYGNGLNMPKEVYDNHWTATNTNAKYPIISRTVSSNVSNRWVEDGSYLRLKNISLAYNVPVKKMKTKSFSNLQLYMSAQNMLTITKYSWWDPEVNANGGANSTAQGFDNYSYPIAKTFTFGIRAGF